MRGFLSIDIDVSDLQVNQCSSPKYSDYHNQNSNKLINYDDVSSQIEAFHDSHKCHTDSMQVSN